MFSGSGVGSRISVSQVFQETLTIGQVWETATSKNDLGVYEKCLLLEPTQTSCRIFRAGSGLCNKPQMSLTLTPTGGRTALARWVNPGCLIESPESFSKVWGRAPYLFFLKALRIILVGTLNGELL